MIVGGLGTIVNEGVYITSAKFIPIAGALLLGIEVSIIFNFLLNDWWTFKGMGVNTTLPLRLVKFHVSSALGGVVQYFTTILFLIEFLHFTTLSEIFIYLFLYNYLNSSSLTLLFTNFLGIVSSFAIRFITSIKYVWS